MTTTTASRSVWGVTTDEFKRQHRAYLLELAQSDDQYADARRDLIQHIEWCLDRWNHWREKFYPETNSPLLFPFIQAAKGGSEFGHYSVCGASGQPSVIHIRRDFLLGERDITLAKWRGPDGTVSSLMLSADHPRRNEVVDLLLLHELVHQYLHEGANAGTRRIYGGTESKKSGGYKGHGPLFCAEANRINQILQPELGFEHIPLRHSKRSHAARGDEQRVSCAQFAIHDLFFAWDLQLEYPDPKYPDAPYLSAEQVQDNVARLQQALRYFGGAIELVKVGAKEDESFPAPYDASCADVCLQMLQSRDGGTPGLLVREFHLATLRDMKKAGMLDERLAMIGYEAGAAAAPSDIRAVEQQNTPATIESAPVPTVSAAGDTEPEWQVFMREAHSRGHSLRPAVAICIERIFTEQDPPRSFNGWVAGVFGCTREGVRQAVKNARLKAEQAAA